MGFFGGGYSRPGKGVTKEEAAKRNYFEIFGRKFSKLLQLNMLYVAVNILFFGGSILLAIPYDWNQVLDYFSQNQIFLLPVLPFIPLMFIGPFTAGLTYVIRNYAKQEHAFMASDFFEHSKKNWKQALIVSILSTAVLYLFLETFIFYRNFAPTHGISYALVYGISLVIGILLISMSFYVYPMMVTFDMKLRHILKNAWIFAIAKLPQNLFFIIIIGAVHLLLIFYAYPIWVVGMLIILISWTSYTINYYVWHVMDKHMLSQLEKDEKDKEEPVFEDNLLKK